MQRSARRWTSVVAAGAAVGAGLVGVPAEAAAPLLTPIGQAPTADHPEVIDSADFDGDGNADVDLASTDPSDDVVTSHSMVTTWTSGFGS